MSKIQIERLRQDSKELSHYIARLQKHGNQDRAYKLAKKQAFLDQTISQYSQI